MVGVRMVGFYIGAYYSLCGRDEGAAWGPGLIERERGVGI